MDICHNMKFYSWHLAKDKIQTQNFNFIINEVCLYMSSNLALAVFQYFLLLNILLIVFYLYVISQCYFMS